MEEEFMRIKQANVQPIIGVEMNAMGEETVHVLDLHIQAKGINPSDFKNMTGRYDVIFDKAPLPPVPKKYVVEYFTWSCMAIIMIIIAYITEGYVMAGRVFFGMLILLGVVHLIVWMQNKYKVEF